GLWCGPRMGTTDDAFPGGPLADPRVLVFTAFPQQKACNAQKFGPLGALLESLGLYSFAIENQAFLPVLIIPKGKYCAQQESQPPTMQESPHVGSHFLLILFDVFCSVARTPAVQSQAITPYLHPRSIYALYEK